MDGLGLWHEKLETNKPVIDVGFHLIVTDLKSGGSLADLAKLPDEGVTSYKLFMAYKGTPFHVDDETLFKTMQVASQNGCRVMVHAENGDAIDVLVKEALAAGNTAPKYHSLTRPPETEGEATNRAIQLAHIAGCPVYIVHVSCEDAIEPIERAREKGWNVVGETCTQYLWVDFSKIDQPGFEGAKYVYTPPPRDRHHVEACWEAIVTDKLSVVSTDHAPFNFKGQKDMGGTDDFSKIPNGPPGIEERLKILHTYGVGAGRFDLNRMVQLFATNPAKLFGLYPRKGTIAVGSDADLVLFDPDKKETISVATHHSTCDYNLFEGTEVTGVPGDGHGPRTAGRRRRRARGKAGNRQVRQTGPGRGEAPTDRGRLRGGLMSTLRLALIQMQSKPDARDKRRHRVPVHRRGGRREAGSGRPP